MEIKTTVVEEHIIVVELANENFTEDALKECFAQILQNKYCKIVMDFADVDYIGAEGLKILLDKIDVIRDEGGVFLFAGIHSQVAEILKHAGVYEKYNFVKDTAIAVQLFLEQQVNFDDVTITNLNQLDATTDLIPKEWLQKTEKIHNDVTCDDISYAVTEQKSTAPQISLDISSLDEEIQIALLGKSAAIEKIHREILQLTSGSQGILLLGKENCGEQAIAQAIHRNYVQTDAFVTIDFANLHFSRSKDEIKTLIELAKQGSLFLKNIHTLSMTDQDIIFELLLTNNITNVICHCDKNDIGKLSFQINSFFSGHVVQIPTLIERLEDIVVIAENYIRYYAKKYDKRVRSLDEKSHKYFLQHTWPNNIRELQNIIQQHVARVAAEQTHLVIQNSELIPIRYLDHYRLIEKIAEGGMGEVWKGKHHSLERPVVVKLIREDTDDEDLEVNLKRFQLEAQTIAELQSPHTVTLYDFGIHNDNTVYYVMEMLHGCDLAELVERFGPVPPQRTIYLLSQICFSLMEAHLYGVIHRDIKPQNIFLCKLGLQYDFIKVLDFGIAKKQGDFSNLTGDNIVGSPPYIAPELAISNEIDDKVDVYSFGCTAFWLLSGQYVFESNNTLSLISKHVSERPKRISVASEYTIPDELDTLIMSCLEKKPQKRPSFVEIQNTLHTIESSWTNHEAQLWWAKHLPHLVKI
ncbi:protein kinase domain-containing protein [Candidatus Uabimicrobium amorphum]|uniref:Serine/threonine protein kinase n=1 Tax=Uabimicrobium amorphum TaxID=2596890 RepID=A0A5S9F5L0_UABAM|nr:protein kinase [Candidatus Uabimicrobium amorphum]BBM86738.1 serine/threonine protein kinase [Candidatus Uabimicrobium amorphum]